jgi:RNA polymerase sigma-70 factor (ECF subfamily)
VTGHQARLSDAVLAARARDGDVLAFEQLVRRHQAAMYAVAVRILVNRHDAQDATQSAFITAWRRLPQYHGRAEFSTWLYRIVTNQALNLLRARWRAPEPTGDVEPAPRGADPYRHTQARALLDDLRTALAALPDELRVCWILREVDGCSYQQVATLAGISVDTARGRIYRARRQLAERMAAWR